MTHRIVWRQTAQDDIDKLYDWIADQAGGETADNYIGRIKAHVEKLGDLPWWGARREELGVDVRTITFRRRTIVAYFVEDETVKILSVFHGGQALHGLFNE